VSDEADKIAPSDMRAVQSKPKQRKPVKAMTDENITPPHAVIYSAERNFLDHYFASIHTKLEADALLFNRQLPHSGLVGTGNEQAIAEVLRDFLPIRFGIEVNAMVIDRLGETSKQADIVIYDAHNQPNFLRKVFPVEMVYAVIEVKTSMNSTEAASALDNLKSVNALEFRPNLTPFWQTKTSEEQIAHYPPRNFIFSYRTNCESFETFARWFSWDDFFGNANEIIDPGAIRTLTVVALDQGTIRMESTNGHVQRFLAEIADTQSPRVLPKSLGSKPVLVDPAKSLFFFMHRLWSDLQDHKLHPGFDIRSYVSTVLGSMIQVGNDLLYDFTAGPNDNRPEGA
jgi:hypothetical protein